MKTIIFRLLFQSIAIVLISGLLMAPSCRNEKYDDESFVDDYQPTDNQPPAWAPPYDNTVAIRYYYFPDYCIYYDVWSAQYVYWTGNGWVYAVRYPSFIGAFNPFHAHIVIVNHAVLYPWRNHQHYLALYPKHYYLKNFYAPRGGKILRGFNENNKKSFFVAENSDQGKALNKYVKEQQRGGNKNSFSDNKSAHKMSDKQQKNFSSPPNRTAQQPVKNKKDQRNFQKPVQKKEAPAVFQQQQKPVKRNSPLQQPKGGGNSVVKSGKGNEKGGKNF